LPYLALANIIVSFVVFIIYLLALRPHKNIIDNIINAVIYAFHILYLIYLMWIKEDFDRNSSFKDRRDYIGTLIIYVTCIVAIVLFIYGIIKAI